MPSLGEPDFEPEKDEGSPSLAAQHGAGAGSSAESASSSSSGTGGEGEGRDPPESTRPNISHGCESSGEPPFMMSFDGVQTGSPATSGPFFSQGPWYFTNTPSPWQPGPAEQMFNAIRDFVALPSVDDATTAVPANIKA